MNTSRELCGLLASIEKSSIKILKQFISDREDTDMGIDKAKLEVIIMANNEVIHNGVSLGFLEK